MYSKMCSSMCERHMPSVCCAELIGAEALITGLVGDQSWMSSVQAIATDNRAPLCVMLRSQDMKQKIFCRDAAEPHQ